MFYSHEILTSRKHGVATIWVIATLGSKSTLKKINRKEISDVDVPKACEVIVSPEVPMALRLQSHLLYGVSRVYSQQCGYVLTDAQSIQNSIIQAFRQMNETNELDPAAGRTRPELLLIPDDPMFDLDLALSGPTLVPDLLGLDLTIDGLNFSQQSSLLLPEQQNSSQSSREAGAGIRIPADDSTLLRPRGVEDFDFVLGRDASTINRPSGFGRDILDDLHHDLDFSHDADFGFDADGNLFDIDPASSTSRLQGLGPPRSRASSDARAIERVRQEHEEAQRHTEQYADDYFTLEDAQPLGDPEQEFPAIETVPPQISQPEHGSDPAQHSDFQPEQETGEVEESFEAAAAVMARQPRRPKVLQPDMDTQIQTATLSDWNRSYVEIMTKNTRLKAHNASRTLARRNADYWVWGSGIGDLSNKPRFFDLETAFFQFFGDDLMARLIAAGTPSAGMKRDRDTLAEDVDDESGEAARRTRPRSDTPGEQGRTADDIGLADPVGALDDGLGDIGDADVELGREAPTPLAGEAIQDRTSLSLMPWNLSASRHSSNRQTGARLTGFASQADSVGSGRASLPRGLGQSHRVGRLTSASPLLGRGHTEQSAGLADDNDVDMTDTFDLPDYLGLDLGVGAASMSADNDASGPLGGQEATHGSSHADLDVESRNFLEFVRRAAEDATAAVGQEQLGQQDDSPMPLEALEGDDAQAVLFEKLLPPEENSAIVAAQGLIHLLLLASKGYLSVIQTEGFGEISMRVLA